MGNIRDLKIPTEGHNSAADPFNAPIPKATYPCNPVFQATLGPRLEEELRKLLPGQGLRSAVAFKVVDAEPGSY